MVSWAHRMIDQMLIKQFFRYRAEIVAIQVNKAMPHELLFDVYFLDYGDSQFIGKKDILELRTDFLSLRFQAIECFLANIQPCNGGNKMEEWDEKTVEAFEKMVQAARWKKLISKVVAYKDRKSFAFQRQSKQRESSPIPGVELYDSDENADKNIALELVKSGYAEMTDHFGDLSRSSILNSPTEELQQESVPEEPKPVGSFKTIERTETEEVSKPETVISVKQPEVPKLPEVPEEPEAPKEPESIKEPEVPSKPEALERPKAPKPSSSKSSKPRVNGSTTKKPSTAESNLFPGEKSSKPNKKQKVSDFLKNEQEATTATTKKKEPVDWNAMLEE